MRDEALALGFEGLVEGGGDLIEGFGGGGGFFFFCWLRGAVGGGLAGCGAVCGSGGLEECGGGGGRGGRS